MSIERALKQNWLPMRVVLARTKGDPLSLIAAQKGVTVVDCVILSNALVAKESIRREEINQDVGERFSILLREVRLDGFVIKRNWDDLVSLSLSERFLQNPNAGTLLVEQGFISDETGKSYLMKRNMHRYYGTTVIVRSNLLGVEEGESANKERFKRQILGECRSYVRCPNRRNLKNVHLDAPSITHRRGSGEDVVVLRSAKELAQISEPDAHEEVLATS